MVGHNTPIARTKIQCCGRIGVLCPTNSQCCGHIDVLCPTNSPSSLWSAANVEEHKRIRTNTMDLMDPSFFYGYTQTTIPQPPNPPIAPPPLPPRPVRRPTNQADCIKMAASRRRTIRVSSEGPTCLPCPVVSAGNRPHQRGQALDGLPQALLHMCPNPMDSRTP